jgi:hypothetical protein
MLSLPSKGFRIRAALVLAALYALCILAPSVAFALSDNPSIAHCLTEGHVGVHVHGDNTHVHADGTAHQHHDRGTAHRHHDDGTSPKSSADGKGSVANCCGLFSVVAMSGEPDLVLAPSTHLSAFVGAPREVLSGRGPDRLYRPPIVLLSL